MATNPFGERRPGRLHRALIYFGLAAERDAAGDTSPGGAPRDPEPAAPQQRRPAPAASNDSAPAPKPRTWQRNALLYFGLVDDEEQVKSRYGDGVTAKLDGDVDDLELRVAALEDELRQARRTS
jgi:hypothetical protein